MGELVRILVGILVVFVSCLGHAMNLDVAMSRADLQNAHDELVALVKQARNDDIKARLRAMRRYISSEDMQNVLNFVQGRSILFQALKTTEIDEDIIELLLKNGADANFAVRKRARNGGRAAQYIDAETVASQAGRSEWVITMLQTYRARIFRDDADSSSDDDVPELYNEVLSPKPRIVAQNNASPTKCERFLDVALIVGTLAVAPFIHRCLTAQSHGTNW